MREEPVAFHLVIPCFEESARLPPFLRNLLLLLRNKEYRASILVVDDGSSAEEQARLKATLSELDDTCGLTVGAMYLERNMGKGYAVRQGWRAGRSAQWLAFADADGATPAYEVVRILDTVYRDNDTHRCYFGSRIRMLGRSVKRPFGRHVVSRMYGTLVGLLINESVYDSQCGFKVVSGEAFAAIAGVLQPRWTPKTGN